MNVYNNSVKDNRAFGLPNEQPVIDILMKYFNEVITKTIERYCPYDAYSDTCKYEIKTRRNKYSTYPDTIISLSKTKLLGKKRFIFSFTDGLYYIEYDEELFNTFDKKEMNYFKNNIQIRNVSHILIPIDMLIKIPTLAY